MHKMVYSAEFLKFFYNIILEYTLKDANNSITFFNKNITILFLEMEQLSISLVCLIICSKGCTVAKKYF